MLSFLNTSRKSAVSLALFFAFITMLLVVYPVHAASDITQIGSLGASAATDDNTLENFTLASGTNRALIVVASHAHELDITTVTFNGLPLTQVTERNDTFAVDSIWVRAMGSSASPTVGNIVVTRAGTNSSMQVILAVAYENVDQTTPMDAPQSNQAIGANLVSTVTVTSAAGDLVFDVFDSYRNATPQPTNTIGGGQTLLHSPVGGTIASGGFGTWTTSTEPGAASVTMSWTSNSEAILHLAANINRAPNSPPTISDSANQSINEDTATSAIPITVGDAETAVTALTMSGSSSNLSLVSNTNIVFGGIGANRLVTVTPAANQFGSATIVITVTDGGGLTASDTFLLTVNALADTSSVTNATTNEDTQTTSGLVISRNVADDSEVTHFKITGISNGSLFQNDGTTAIANNDFITFAQANAGLKFTPNPNFSGNGSLTVQASTSASDSGLGGSTVSATITVNPVNDLPSFVAGGNQLHAAATNTAQTIPGWATAISDGDVGVTQVLTFNLTNDNNALFSSQPSLDSSNGTLSYTPSGISGSATVSVSLTDDASAGGSALTSAVQTFTISIAATPLCFTSLDGTTTYTSSIDSQAVRDTVAALPGGGVVHIAGYCAGVSGAQLVDISQPMMLIGGYQTISDTGIVTWSVRDFATYPTTLDALGAGRVIRANQPLTVENLLIQNGFANNNNGGGIHQPDHNLWLFDSEVRNNIATGNATSGFGGGVNVARSAFISGTRFISNSAESDGGGLRVRESAMIVNSTFLNNRSTEFSGAGAFVFITATVTGSTFTNNQAHLNGGGLRAQTIEVSQSHFLSNTAGENGGGLRVLGSATIVSSTFADNRAALEGGGAFVAFNASVDETTFHSNTAVVNGGGLWIGAQAQISTTQFISNTAVKGGGLYAASPDSGSLVADSTFNNNVASDEGGAIFTYDSNGLQMARTRFANNQATNGGGAIYVGENYVADEIVNNLFVGNRSVNGPAADIDLDGSSIATLIARHNTHIAADATQNAIHAGTMISNSLAVSNSILYGYAIGLWTSPDTTISAERILFDSVMTPTDSSAGGALMLKHGWIGDAAFVDAPNGDFRLMAASAAVDVGTNVGVIDDYDQAIRPQGGAPDLGAFESSYGLPIISIGDGSVTEGDSGSITLTLPITLSFAKGITVTVQYTTSASSATDGIDYTGILNGTLLFAPGQVSQGLAIPVLGDVELESNETFTVTLGEAQFAGIDDGEASGLIVENDTPTPTVTSTPTATDTPTATATDTATATATVTATVTATTSPTVSLTPNPTNTPIPTVTQMPGGSTSQVYLPLVTKE